MSVDYDVTFNFQQLLAIPREELFRELVITTESIAQLYQRVGYLRAEEARNPRDTNVKSERVEAESIRSAYDEKKWLLIRLLEMIH